MIITCKEDSLALLVKGALGNRLATWNTREVFMREAPRESHYSVRLPKRDQPAIYNQTYMQVVDRWVWQNLIVNESAPDHQLVMQGEVCESPYGLELRYSTECGLKMRQAMRASRRARGLQAHMLLRSVLWPSDLEDLRALFDQYPGAVVEFSSYEVSVGEIPGRNTLFWEVRHF